MKFKEFFIKNRETVQLAYGIILIIIIPTLIVLNTILIIGRYNRSIDVILQRQALTFGRTIYSALRDDLGNRAAIQARIDELKKRNSEIEDLSILVPEGDNFKVSAALHQADLDKVISFYFYQVAWTQPDNDGLATDSLNLASLPESETFSSSDYSDRFWLVALPLADSGGTKKALLSLKLSSKIVDELTNYNRNMSVYLLVLTVLIVILFLAATVRLWDYVLLYQKIKEVDQMKDEFISMASHELRTPITGIRGYVSLILDGSFGAIDTKVKENLFIVQNAAARLASLVEDLLNVSRIEQNRLTMNLQLTAVGPIITDTVKELKIQANEKKLNLEYQAPAKELPSIKIDPERFKQVLINLIGNAIKYTQQGKVEIFVEVKNNLLEIRVKDTGIGMTSEERKRLFAKFYRVQNEITEKVTGTGLGLWITKRIVELMRGTITIDSIKGSGTQATLNFPVETRHGAST